MYFLSGITVLLGIAGFNMFVFGFAPGEGVLLLCIAGFTYMITNSLEKKDDWFADKDYDTLEKNDDWLTDKDYDTLKKLEYDDWLTDKDSFVNKNKPIEEEPIGVSQFALKTAAEQSAAAMIAALKSIQTTPTVAAHIAKKRAIAEAAEAAEATDR